MEVAIAVFGMNLPYKHLRHVPPKFTFVGEVLCLFGKGEENATQWKRRNFISGLMSDTLGPFVLFLVHTEL